MRGAKQANSSNVKNLFRNREVLLFTMHKKETVISPLLQESLGVSVWVPDNINTDVFGTFSGEIERPSSQYNTAKLKIKKAFELYPDYDLAIASESAFSIFIDKLSVTLELLPLLLFLA